MKKTRTRRMMKTLILSTIFIIFLFSIDRLDATYYLKERILVIEEKVLFKNLPKATVSLRLWLPYPVEDNWQEIDDFKLTGPFENSLIIDKEYGNKIIYLKAKPEALNNNASQLVLSFRVQRKEFAMPFDSKTSKRPSSRFLKPDKFVPIDGVIKTLAKKITEAKKNDLEKVRAIYDYIIDELTYYKDDPKICGLGDSLLTLQYKKGICTDYHSLFISLVRSLGIPAKFEIGFRIPEDKNQGELNGYHCWAKFFLKDKGWIPVDVSEADKHPDKRDYFFGHIDESRVHLTTGRDLKLKYTNDLGPINFFVYPYVEVNGARFNNMDVQVSYKDLGGGG